MIYVYMDTACYVQYAGCRCCWCIKTQQHTACMTEKVALFYFIHSFMLSVHEI